MVEIRGSRARGKAKIRKGRDEGPGELVGVANRMRVGRIVDQQTEGALAFCPFPRQRRRSTILLARQKKDEESRCLPRLRRKPLQERQ